MSNFSSRAPIDHFDVDVKKPKNDCDAMKMQNDITMAPRPQHIDSIKTMSAVITTTETTKLKSTIRTKCVEELIIPFAENDRIAQMGSTGLCSPSSAGRVICMKYKKVIPSKTDQIKTKMPKSDTNIKAFQFDTKSPDDIALEALQKRWK
ncbi:uncharacterized protein LOC119690152 [Teleopsis dalmanni]|uniref:uncharacterized protein LOC119690152 n=1 Tax=Teleopsis dalmanni TaxID=139649 RepID=UPI0018CF12BE|nr:uncharacterized protein LOC119690152 [Teleopsis dalmanni]